MRAYHARIGESGWNVRWPDLVHLKTLSDLYWTVTFCHRETRSFQYEWIEGAMRRLEVYERWLRAAFVQGATPGDSR